MNNMLPLSARGGRKNGLYFNGGILLFPDYDAFRPEFKTAVDQLGSDFIFRQNRLSRTKLCRKEAHETEKILRKFIFPRYSAGKTYKNDFSPAI